MNKELSLIDSRLNKTRTITHDVLLAPDVNDRDVKINVYRPSGGSDETTPIVLANGWTAGNVVMRRAAIWLAYNGRTAVTFDHHRQSKPDEAPEIHKMETLAAAVDGTLQYTDSDYAEVIAHSEGGINGTLYVDRERERESGKVKSATLFAPAGIIELSVPQLLYRGAREIVSLADHRQVRHIGRLASAGTAVGDYLSKNLKLSFSEVQAISDTNVVDKIVAIHESPIDIGVIGCTDDKFFPDHELRAALPPQIEYTTIHSNHIDFINDRDIRHQVYGFHRSIGHAAARPEAV
jgi:pimeloyl-ACP methyl ester carboxylesterase